jgi:hypothetical protein
MLEMPRDTKQKMYCSLVRIFPTKNYRSYCRRGLEKISKEVLENKDFLTLMKIASVENEMLMKQIKSIIC